MPNSTEMPVWSTADVRALKASIASGAKSVRYSDGRLIEYHSLDEMLRLLRFMISDVYGGVDPTTSGAVRLPYFTRD